MFQNESEWIGKEIQKLVNDGAARILNIGSSTGHYRKILKPYIHDNIFAALEKAQVHVTHSDIKMDEGIDLAGDLQDPKFLETIKNNHYDIVICSNLLEHLEDKEPICKALVNIVNPGGFLIITVPYLYPYHLDPIDTMFRPNIEELADSFSGVDLVEGVVIEDSKTYAEKLANDKRLAAIIFFRSFLPFYKPKVWWNTVRYLPYSFRKFQTTCIVLKKKNPE